MGFTFSKHEMVDVNLNFIISGDEVKGIFELAVNNKELVKFLENKIHTWAGQNQRNLNDIALYRVDGSQPNYALASTLKTPKTENERLGELMDPQKTISSYFPADPKRGQQPFPEYDGEISAINIIIYPPIEATETA